MSTQINRGIDKLAKRIARQRVNINRKAAFLVRDGIRGVTPKRSGRLRASLSVYRDGDAMIVAPERDARLYASVITFGKRNQAANNFMYRGFRKQATRVNKLIINEYRKLL